MENLKALTTKPTTSTDKSKAALPGLCAYGSSDSNSDNSEDEEEIQPLKIPSAVPAEKKASGLLGILPPPKQNQFMNKKNPTQSLTASDFFTASSKNTSTIFKDASSLVPRTLKTKPVEETEAPVTSKKLKPSYDTYVNKPDPVVPTFAQYAQGEDPEPEFEEKEEEEETEIYRPEEFGAPALDEEAIRQLSKDYLNVKLYLTNGSFIFNLSGGKRGRHEIPVNIQSINVGDVVDENRRNLMKNLTSNYKPPSNRDFFVGGGKKKSQITYLAYVAKERDEELKNQWASNAYAKQESRKRYGF